MRTLSGVSTSSCPSNAPGSRRCSPQAATPSFFASGAELLRLDPADGGHQAGHDLRQVLGALDQVVEAAIDCFYGEHSGDEEVFGAFVVGQRKCVLPAFFGGNAQAVDVGGKAFVEVGKLLGRIVGRVNRACALQPEEGGFVGMLGQHMRQWPVGHRVHDASPAKRPVHACIDSSSKPMYGTVRG
jgi:hypothetical protein